jgi:hypothetical protein
LIIVGVLSGSRDLGAGFASTVPATPSAIRSGITNTRGKTCGVRSHRTVLFIIFKASFILLISV